MAVPALGTSHLQQTKLSETASGLLEPLGRWLSNLHFTPQAAEFETFASPKLHDQVEPLLSELDLRGKVNRASNAKRD